MGSKDDDNDMHTFEHKYTHILRSPANSFIINIWKMCLYVNRVRERLLAMCVQTVACLCVCTVCMEHGNEMMMTENFNTQLYNYFTNSVMAVTVVCTPTQQAIPINVHSAILMNKL